MLAAFVLVGGAPAAFADKGGTAHYEYKVTSFDYNADGAATGDIERGGCVPFEDAGWTGHVVGRPAEVSSLGKIGEGKLTIGRRGSFGDIEANQTSEYTFSDSEHTLVTECNGDGEHPGQQTDTALTQCATESITSETQATVSITGRVGDRVKLEWGILHTEGGAVGSFLLPDVFSCVEPFEFPYKQCKTKAGLQKFTQKIVKLRYKCIAQTATPPAGKDYTTYVATSIARGAIVLKRTKQR